MTSRTPGGLAAGMKLAKGPVLLDQGQPISKISFTINLIGDKRLQIPVISN